MEGALFWRTEQLVCRATERGRDALSLQSSIAFLTDDLPDDALRSLFLVLIRRLPVLLDFSRSSCKHSRKVEIPCLPPIPP